ncbi:44678_t:CDS:2, partial [Gigaspora margarita]
QLELNDYEDNELVQEVVQDLWKFFQSKNCEKILSMFLDKKELDLVLMGQLMAFEYNQTNEIIKKFNYQFNNDIKLFERLHGNTKRIPNTKKRIKIDQTLSTLISTFISNYANVHGYPSPGRHLQHDTQTIIYLPMDKDYTKVYANFIECLNIFPEKPFDKIGYKSFVRIWKELLSHIKFVTPGTDLCETCEMLKAEIRRANYNEEKELIQKRLYNHKQKAEIEREYYHNINKYNMPYSPQQIGTSYFKSALQAHIFGICNTGQNPAQQFNYIIAENEFPKGTVGMYDTIEVNFMVTGHTKFICDGYFGNIKTLYRKTVINTVDDVYKVINKSTQNSANNGICYNDGDPGKVLCQTEAHSTYSTFKILKNTFNVNEVLDKIPLKSIFIKRTSRISLL